MKEGKDSIARGQLKFSTTQGKEIKRKNRIEVDNFVDGVIRQKIHSFYAVSTIGKLLAALKEDQVITCSREFLRLCMKLVFKCKKCA